MVIAMKASTAIHSNLAPLVLVIGLISLIHDSWPDVLPHRGNLHAVFGVLLWLCVVARCYERFTLRPRISMCDIRRFSRHLSHLVYLLLYVLMFFRLIIGILRAAAQHTLLPIDGFQSYLAYGVLALVTIHALAALGRAKWPADVARTGHAETPRPVDRFGNAYPRPAEDAGSRAAATDNSAQQAERLRVEPRAV